MAGDADSFGPARAAPLPEAGSPSEASEVGYHEGALVDEQVLNR